MTTQKTGREETEPVHTITRCMDDSERVIEVTDDENWMIRVSAGSNAKGWHYITGYQVFLPHDDNEKVPGAFHSDDPHCMYMHSDSLRALHDALGQYIEWIETEPMPEKPAASADHMEDIPF